MIESNRFDPRSPSVQGRCGGCKVAFRWNTVPGGVRYLYEAACPRCGKPLIRTVHSVKLPWVEGEQPKRRAAIVEVIPQGFLDFLSKL